MASVNGVSEVLNALALLNLFMQKKMADFRTLPFMLKCTLDHLDSIRESDATGVLQLRQPSNLETEHGITIKGSKGPTVRKSPPCQFKSFEYKWLFPPYLGTLIANINSCFSGEVVELVVSASVLNPALLPDDETLLRAYSNSKLSTLANFYGEKAEVTFEGITYSFFSCYYQ